MPLLLAPTDLPSAFSRSDLPGLGLSPRDLRRLLGDGQVVQLLRGAYAPAHLADEVEVRAAAAGLVLPAGAAVARTTAAWLHGVDARSPGRHLAPVPLECVVPCGTTPPRRPGLAATAAEMEDHDVTVLAGVPVTTPTRTAIDLARYLPPHLGLGCVDALAHAGLVHPARLAEELGRWTGQRFVARARRCIALCEPATESPGESWLRLRVVDAGFPPPEPQIWVHDAGGRRLYRLDMGWRLRRKAVEYDGVEFHGPDRAASDRARRGELERDHGWDVLVAGRGEVLGRGTALERALGELLGLEPHLTRRAW